jgi:hypothetical protein
MMASSSTSISTTISSIAMTILAPDIMITMLLDQIGFQAGDVLVVDASRRAIASGQTDAPLLRELDSRGVAVYSREGLHAKVLLLGAYSVIGSANMSGSSDVLIEAAVISDSDVIASGVEVLHRTACDQRRQADARHHRSAVQDRGGANRLDRGRQTVEAAETDSFARQPHMDRGRQRASPRSAGRRAEAHRPRQCPSEPTA